MTTTLIPVPRALARGLMSVQAAAEPPTMKSLAEAFETFKAKHISRVDALEAHADEMATKYAAANLNGGGGTIRAPEPEYSKAFASYTRRGASEAEASLAAANATGERQAIQAAMSVSDNSSGGYLAPVEWDRKISQAQRAVSPMRRISRVVTTSVGAYSTLWSNDQWGSGWVGETAARPATTTASLQPLTVPAGEIFAMPAATQRLLDDSAIDFEAWIAAELADEFAVQEGIAFLSGDGVNKPMGFLSYVPGGVGAAAHPGGPLSVMPSGNAATIPSPDVLVDLKYGLGAPYRQNATWLMNSQTAGMIAKMKTADGAFIWREGLTLAEPATLLGRPVEIDENMPNIGAAVDNVAKMPIAFGDFARGYLINDRTGVRLLRDPFTNKPFVLFYSTKRVGGGVVDPKAIRVLKVAAN